MSEFYEIDINMQDKACLVDTLVEMGYKPSVHEDAIQLYGYQGDKRSQKANIVIPRSQVGSASNDIGFENIDGNFVLRISEFDKKQTKRFNIDKLKQIYATKTITKVIKSSGRYSVKSSKVDKNGSNVINVVSFF